MRVTLVSPFDPNPRRAAPADGHVGGVERVFGHIAHSLTRRGHEVTLVCSTDGPAHETVEEGVRVLRNRRRLTILRAPLTRLARSLSPDADIVHVPATYPFTTPSVLRRARALDVPSVLDFHFEPAPGTAVGQWAASLYRRLGPRAYPLAEAVLVRSFAYAQASPSLAEVPRDRWRLVPNGIDPKRFRPHGSAPAGAYLLFVGRLVPYKGLHVLLQALARFPSALPLVVAGDGPQRRSLEALARRLRIRVRFLGHVADGDLPELYRRAAVTVLPSVTQQEAFGLTLLESMACGTPVVASDLPGVAELARQGGLVAPPGDVERLAAQLRCATELDGLPRGEILSNPIRAAYSWDAVTDRLIGVYEEILDQDHKSAPEVTTVAHPRGHPLL